MESSLADKMTTDGGDMELQEIEKESKGKEQAVLNKSVRFESEARREDTEEDFPPPLADKVTADGGDMELQEIEEGDAVAGAVAKEEWMNDPEVRSHECIASDLLVEVSKGL